MAAHVLVLDGRGAIRMANPSFHVLVPAARW